MSRQINIRLDENQIGILESFGGQKKGVVALINKYIKESEQTEPTPERDFFDCLYLPSEKNLSATYIAFMNAYISKGNLAGTLGAYINKIMGETGYDDATTRKHFRKLAGSGFIKPVKNMMFRPTLRLRTEDKEAFGGILENYSTFLRCELQFVDYWESD